MLYGTPAGLTGTGSQYFTQNGSGVGGTAEQYDDFGAALTAGDFDHDSFADLAVGVPAEDSSLDSVGAVNVLYGTPTGLTRTGGQYFTQNSPGVWSTSEEGDRFGYSLSASGP